MLAALLSFRDQADDLRSGSGDASSPVSVAPSRHNSDGPPPVPTKSAAEVVTALQSINKVRVTIVISKSLLVLMILFQVQQNVVIVGDQGHAEDYAKHCVDMLKASFLMF
jgi:hypothetical protein